MINNTMSTSKTKHKNAGSNHKVTQETNKQQKQCLRAVSNENEYQAVCGGANIFLPAATLHHMFKYAKNTKKKKKKKNVLLVDRLPTSISEISQRNPTCK